MRRKTAAIALAGLLCVSCLPVPFDLSLSKAAAITANMTRDNPRLITAGSDEGGSRTDQAFYAAVEPTGGFDYSLGFATATDGQSVDVSAIAGGSPFASQPTTLNNPDPHDKPYIVWPVKSGASGVACLFGTSFDMLNPAMNGYGVFVAASPSAFSGSGEGYHDLLAPLVPSSNPTVIGASVEASPSLSVDKLHVLVEDPSTLDFVEGSFDLGSISPYLMSFALIRGSVFYALPFIPAGTNRVLYYYDDIMGRSYASLFDATQGGWVCYAWDDTTTFMRLPVRHRIDALLSNSQLLSTENGTARVYDRNGILRATFDLGNLVFIAEEYVGGQPRCYFSQALIYDGTLHFNVYWIPTSRLASLGT